MIPITDVTDLLAGFAGNASIVLRDPDLGQETAVNPAQVMRAASLIKLPLVWSFFHACTQGRLDPDEPVAITAESLVPGFGVLRSLHPGMKLRLRDLAALAILVSDNSATNILIDRLGFEPVNRTIEALGMAQTVLMRKMYDRSDPAKENYTSAQDIATFYARLLQAEAAPGVALAPEYRAEFMQALRGQQCRNKLPSGLARDAALAHKTGDQPQVEHDAGIFFGEQRRLIAVVMTCDLAANPDGVLLCRRVGDLAYQWVSDGAGVLG